MTARKRCPGRMLMVPVAVISAIPWCLAAESPRMEFWSAQRRGANYGPSRLRTDAFRAAARAGIEFFRLQLESLKPQGRDFLMGDADRYERLNAADLAQLRAILDEAEKHGIKIVLTMFSLPGCRAKRDVSDRSDGRLWRDERYQEQAFAFWRDLARELAAHPAIVAYNPLNEPHPDREYGFESPDDPRFAAWLERIRGTTPDVDRFNARMVATIRESDPNTPILLDGWFYADPGGFRYNMPVADRRTLYAVHNLGPWVFTAFRANKGRFEYPNRMPAKDDGVARWTIDDLKPIVEPVEAFAARHRIPRERIIASEFWCDRRIPGAAEYLADELRIFNERGWHWAFYAFRGEGAWTGLDYEIPLNAKLGKMWEAQKRGEDLEPIKPRGDNAIWTVIQRALRR